MFRVGLKKVFFYLFFFIALLCRGGIVFSQSLPLTDSAFKVKEDSLLLLFSSITRGNSDSVNALYNDLFRNQLQEVLHYSGSYDYRFPSLSKKIGIILSPDEKCKIFNWNVVQKNGSYIYYCFIQIADEADFRIVELTDRSDEIESPSQQIVKPQNWYGALYYDVIVVKDKKKVYYTLLGWDGNDFFTTKKVIDVLHFDEKSNEIEFGANIFKYGKQEPVRVFFEYSNKAAMTLSYNTKLDMIVFDHLSPSKSIYQGHYQYYGPDFSYDGMYWKNGKWILEEDIDVRNPKNKAKNKDAKPTPTQVFFEQNK